MVDTLLTGVMNILANAVSVLVFFAAFALIGLVGICWEKLKVRGLHRVSAISVTLLLVVYVVVYAANDRSFAGSENQPAEKVEIVDDWKVSAWFEKEGVYITAQAAVPEGRMWGGCANETTWMQVEAPNGDELTRLGTEAEEIWRHASLEQGDLKGTRKVAKIIAEACGWSLP